MKPVDVQLEQARADQEQSQSIDEAAPGHREGVALCLSGGGYRAALFHLGALQRLHETGWLALGSNWHYFDSTGAMVKNEWKQDGNLWFYLGEQGAMARNAWIDDQYYVGADGVWVQ